MKTASKAGCAAVFSLFALSATMAFAQVNAKNQGYLVDQNYGVVTSSTTGLCWRTSDWTPARAIAAEAGKLCDPDLQPKPVAAQAPGAPAAPRAAPPKPAPEKMVPQKINFSADALFDFDKAELKPEGKAMLDDLIRVLQGARYEVILAIGHTDRIGTAQYNQKLSVRRAEAVKQYLVGKGIEPNRVYAEGKGKTQPLTKPADCKGKRGKALIACYQPDRRVNVEVSGTK